MKHQKITNAVRAGIDTDGQYGSVMPPVYLSSNYSFELEGGETQVRAFLDGLRCFTLAESLGGVESLVCHPGSMTHAAMTDDAQREAGIESTLLRLSVGIEHVADLIVDVSAGLERALNTAAPAIKMAGYA